MKNLLLGLFSALALFMMAMPMKAVAAQSYQVTGQILKITDSTIIVDKKGEKFEIDKGQGAIPADLKVGDKVTVQYTMSVKKLEKK